MRSLLSALALAAAVASGAAAAQPDESRLQRAFLDAMQEIEAGDPARAERILRRMLEETDSARVKLELARALYLQGDYEASKHLFKQVSTHADTPWRVRDKIAVFVRDIEERTGYLRLGVSIVSDSNPGNLGAPREFVIGGVQVVPTQAPKRLTGARYSAQGWLPVEALDASGYVTASYVDYENQEFDRLTVDVGAAKDFSESRRLRGKGGVEFGTGGGQSLYRFPYVGLEAVVAEWEAHRLGGEVRFGKVMFSDFDYLDATHLSGALTLQRALAGSASATLRASLEGSRAAERPYTYYGWDLAPAVSKLWEDSAFVTGASLSFGSRKYAEDDPLFGSRRADRRTRIDLTVGNKKWRWRDSYVVVAASLEENRSNLAFYAYRKTNLSIVIE